MSHNELRPLPGTAPAGSWRITNANHEEADGRFAIFAIVKRAASTLEFRGLADGELIGTGFFVHPNGGFVTAKHVAIEAEAALSASPFSVGLVCSIPNGLLVFRPIAWLNHHPEADLSFGVPHELYDNTTGVPYRAKVLSLQHEPPAIGEPVSTWAYPLHRKIQDDHGDAILEVRPAFYPGVLQDLHEVRGPSGKLSPPYYQTNIHLHGGSSGGPVFNQSGRVFGVASSSFDGAEDVAFITPIGPVFDIEVRNVNLGDGSGPRTVTVREIAAGGGIIDREI